MRQSTLLLLISLFLLLPGKSYCSTPAASDNRHLPDSLLTISYIRKTAMTDPDRALSLLDESEKRKRLPAYQINWTRSQIYGGIKQMGRIALKWGELVLEDDAVRNKPANYVNMCHNIVEQLIHYKEYEKALGYVEKMLRVAEQDETTLRRIKHDVYWSIAYVYRMKGDREEAYKYAGMAIDAVRSSGDLPLQCSYILNKYYLNKTSWLAEDNRQEEALQIALQLQDIVEQIRPYRGGPFPDKIPEVNFLEVEGTATLLLARMYQETGRADLGRETFARVKNSPALTDNLPVIYQAVNYLLSANRNQEVIAKTLPLAAAYAYPDSIHPKRMEACRILSDTYLREGAYREAMQYAQTAFMLADSLNKRNQESDALELATLIDTQEKEKLIEQQAATIRLHKAILYSVGGMTLLLCAIMGLIVRHSRIISRKNRVMAKQINDRLLYRDELLNARQRIRELEEEKRQQLSAQPEPPVAEAENDRPEAANANDKRLFEELDTQIRDHKLFLDPELNRDHVLRLTPVGKNRLAPLIQTFTGENFNGYINGLRLDYSLSLLDSLGNYTIEAVAVDSGFNNVRTYQRLFRLRYGMTPVEYRKSLVE